MRQRKQLFWQLFPSYAAIVVAALAAVSLFSLGSMKNFYHQQTAKDLEGLSKVVRLQAAPHLKAMDSGVLDQLCKKAGEESLSRVTIIGKDGTCSDHYH